MLPLNVPFLPDPGYVNFLEDLASRLHAIHFSLYEPALNDARVRLEEVDDDLLIDLLTSLPKVRKYLLANGRFQQMKTYTGDAGMHLVGRLEKLVEEQAVDGVVFADSYLLRFLGDTAPRLATRLEAIPSVNFLIDEVGKLTALIELVTACGFRPPGKVAVDRGLNRCPEKLEKFSAAVKKRWPETKVELLVNEGCMPHCPFRATHEALIAAANTGPDTREFFDTQRLNRDLACQRHFLERPQRIFSSPFIRPEDVRYYTDKADLLKICGRTLGTDFLRRTVEAYVHGKYSGNLIDLLDASHWMNDTYHIDNDRLPANFPELLSTCQGDCSSCDICEDLFRLYARSKPLELKDWRG